MPCRDYDNDFMSLIVQKRNEQTISDLRKRNDELTQLLCAVCTHIETYKLNNTHNTAVTNPFLCQPSLVLWWEKHKALDAKRKSAEIEARRKKGIEMISKELEDRCLSDIEGILSKLNLNFPK